MSFTLPTEFHKINFGVNVRNLGQKFNFNVDRNQLSDPHDQSRPISLKELHDEVVNPQKITELTEQANKLQDNDEAGAQSLWDNFWSFVTPVVNCFNKNLRPHCQLGTTINHQGFTISHQSQKPGHIAALLSSPREFGIKRLQSAVQHGREHHFIIFEEGDTIEGAHIGLSFTEDEPRQLTAVSLHPSQKENEIDDISFRPQASINGEDRSTYRFTRNKFS